MVANLEPGAYTLLVSGTNGASGPALVEVYDITDALERPVISAVATAASTDTSPGTAPGSVTISRTGSTDQDLMVNLSRNNAVEKESPMVK